VGKAALFVRENLEVFTEIVKRTNSQEFTQIPTAAIFESEAENTFLLESRENPFPTLHSLTK
jgi:hypothetical protein